MRLLTNIYNEFLVYYNRLIIEGENYNLKLDNLLAIIVYKNLYPVDFTQLQNQQGMVYDVFYRKDEKLDYILEELYKEVEVCKLKIEQLKKEILEDEEELFYVYSEAWNSNGMKYIRNGGSNYKIEKLKDINIIEDFKNSSSLEYSNNEYAYSFNKITFEELMTLKGRKGNYYNRLLAIKSKGDSIKEKINNNYKILKTLDKNIKELKDSSIKTLMNDERFFNILDENIKKEPLIIRLLKYGYIDEMYPYYSLYFYPGRLTKEDFEFVQSVICNRPLSYNFKLTNIVDILDKFRIEDFKTFPILNYDLVKFLSIHSDSGNNRLRLEKLIELLSGLKEEYMEFIVSFIKMNKDEGISNFIRFLCKGIKGLWNNIYISDYISLEDKDLILELILKYISIEDIMMQNNKELIKDYIESRPKFIESIGIKIDESKLKEILIKLNIKLVSIDQEIITDMIKDSNNKYTRILDMIYDSNSYDINSTMISLIVAFKKNSLENIDNINLNYSSIVGYELEGLKEYIDNNINIYMKNIFISDNIKENTDTIIEIINNKNIDMDFKTNIIENKEFKIKDINEIEALDIWNIVIDALKVEYSWKNILSYYKKIDNIDANLSRFINNSQVYNMLLQDTLYCDDINSEEIDLFVESLIKCSDIDDEVISLLSCKLGSPFEEFEFDNISNERVKILIDKNLITLSKSIYESLKTNYKKAHINLLENHIESFIKDKFENFNEHDLELVMKSTNISEENKYIILTIYIDKIEISKNLAEVIFDSIESILLEDRLEYNLIKKLLTTELNKENKIKLLSCQVKYIDKAEITELLMNIDDEYEGLLDLSYENMYISNTPENLVLLENLRKRSYISSYKEYKTEILVHRKRSE